MLMQERSKSSTDCRFGFQGQELDNEIKGIGNSVNYKYRMHCLSREERIGNPRVGRFFAVDPLAPQFPHNSPYAFSENVVINAIELEGLEKSEVTVDQTLIYEPVGDDKERVTQKTVKYYKVFQTNWQTGKSEHTYTIRITNVTSIEIDKDGNKSNQLSYSYGAVLIPEQGIPNGLGDTSNDAFKDIQFSTDDMSQEFKNKVQESVDYNKNNENTYFVDKRERLELTNEGAKYFSDAVLGDLGTMIPPYTWPVLGSADKLIENAIDEIVNPTHLTE